jgi:nucleoside-diphosphate-sugar epimerase
MILFPDHSPSQNRIIREDLATILGQDAPWSELFGCTVLISGANGFLPAYFVETLLHLNELRRGPAVTVVGLVRNVEKAKTRFAGYAERPDFRLLAGDVCDPTNVDGPVDYVIHAASQASPKYFGADPVGTLKANTLGKYHLLELARRKGSKGFLFFSSAEIYGEIDPSHNPVREDYAGWVRSTDVRSCYAESKRLGETMCVSWLSQFGVPAKIVRPFHVYGPGMSLTDGRVFADFVADVVAQRDIVLHSDGSARRCFCYLADATAGFLTVLLRGCAGEAYNIGNDRCESGVLELANLLVGLFPNRGLKVVCRPASRAAGYLRSTVSRSCPDVAKVAALGWTPTTSLAEGFTRTIRSFLAPEEVGNEP